MSNYTIDAENQNEYSLTPLPGVDQTLLTDIGETIYVPLATNTTYGVIKPGDSLSVTNGVLNVEKATENSFGSVKPGVGLSVTNGVLNVEKSEIGLENVDNTSDADKPISDLTQAALNLKVSYIKKHSSESILPMDANFIVNLDLKKSDVGLGNVDNTSDLNKPVSTATRTELDKIINNIVPIKASNGSVQLGEGTNSAANTLQFRSFNFINADGELQTFTGSVMTKVADIDWTDNKIKENVVDNLTTTATDKALSAKQGKILKDLISNLSVTETFDTIEDVVTALNSADLGRFKEGYNLYVRDLEVPDFWISGVEETSTTYTYTTDTALINAVKQDEVQIGYYKISLLETAKVDVRDSVDATTITRNLSDELQAIGIKDQNTGYSNKEWTGTLEEYNALETKDNTVTYYITDDENELGPIPSKTSDLTNDGDGISPFVTESRTIAGVDLQDNITKSELATALGVQADLNLFNGEGTNSLKMKNSNTVSGSNSFAEGSNNVVFADNAHAEGLSVTKATSRGITASSTDSEIQTEWLASDPEGDKFSLAKGENSHIEGSNCLALGSNSHAEGNGTRAVNNSAHTEGTGTVASGKYSHAEGLETVASGARAHSEGDSTVASGDYSHAQGRSTNATHAYSFTSGRNTSSSADYQTVLGKYSASDSQATLIVSTGSKNSARNSFATGHDGSANFLKLGSVKLTESELSDIKQGAIIPEGAELTSNKVNSINQSSTNTQYPSAKAVHDILSYGYVPKTTTIAGVDLQDNITANELKSALSVPSNIADGTGTGSVIANDLTYNVASGDYCFAEGEQTTASGTLGSHAEGYLTIASGSHSHAEGEENTASGQTSHAEGFKSVASGYGTHAEGGRCSATFEYAHAEGQFTTANGFASHAEGCQTTTGTVARQSHAEGYFTEAHNFQSHAEGDYSIAGFNDDTVALFDISATYAENTVVKNGTGLYYLCIKESTGNDLDNTTYWNLIQSNHAEGQNTRSTSVASHAEGVNSIARGKASHAEGNGTYATNNSAHSEGTGSQATGKYSHAEGMESVASGSRSHAEGYTTTASGDSAHAQGRDSVASGKYSFASGRNVTASKENQTALGQYNATDNEALLIVGTGSKSGNTINARNSFATGHDGTASFIKVGSTKFRESEIAKKSDIPSRTIETYTVSSWTALSSSSPYTYQATVTATATIGNDTIVELFNDQAVAFATYGFAIGSISGQNITIYSIGQPSSSVTLKVGIGG